MGEAGCALAGRAGGPCSEDDGRAVTEARSTPLVAAAGQRRSAPPIVKTAAWPRTSPSTALCSRNWKHGDSSPRRRRRIAPDPPRDLRPDRAAPTPEEIDAFVTDKSPNAFEKVVDRLLASPRYGERWGRYWLDVARYARAPRGNVERDRLYPYAYTFATRSSGALNSDKPYDQFVKEQLAADLINQHGQARPWRRSASSPSATATWATNRTMIDDRIDVVHAASRA